MQVRVERWVRGRGASEPPVGFGGCVIAGGGRATLCGGGLVAWDVGGEEVDGTCRVGRCDCVPGCGEEGLGEVFYHGAGFGVEEGAGLCVAVEAEEFEGGHIYFFSSFWGLDFVFWEGEGFEG